MFMGYICNWNFFFWNLRNSFFCQLYLQIAGLMVTFAQNVYLIYAGRAITGFCIGIISLSLPVYLAEAIHPEVRGTLGLLPTSLGKVIRFFLQEFLWELFMNSVAICFSNKNSCPNNFSKLVKNSWRISLPSRWISTFTTLIPVRVIQDFSKNSVGHLLFQQKIQSEFFKNFWRNPVPSDFAVKKS